MDKSVLEEKLKTLEGQFETLNKEKANHEKQASDIEAELFRLQGDFRTLQELLKQAVEADPQPVEDPKTLVVKEDKKAEDVNANE